MLVGESTVVSFEREANQVDALVSRGKVAISQAKDHSIEVRVKYGETVVTPVAGDYTSGKVVVAKQGVSVATKEGSLRVAGGGRVLDVPTGKEATLTKDSAGSTPGVKAVELHQTGTEAGSQGSFLGDPVEDSDCDRDDRSLGPHKPPKCTHTH